jgi:hypothetical protein
VEHLTARRAAPSLAARLQHAVLDPRRIMAIPTPVVTNASNANCGVRLVIPAFQRRRAALPSSQRGDALLRRLAGEVRQCRHHATADRVRIAELELGEDRVDVPFDAARSNRKALGDGAVASTLGNQRKDFALAR